MQSAGCWLADGFDRCLHDNVVDQNEARQAPKDGKDDDFIKNRIAIARPIPCRRW